MNRYYVDWQNHSINKQPNSGKCIINSGMNKVNQYFTINTLFESFRLQPNIWGAHFYCLQHQLGLYVVIILYWLDVTDSLLIMQLPRLECLLLYNS